MLPVSKSYKILGGKKYGEILSKSRKSKRRKIFSKKNSMTLNQMLESNETAIETRNMSVTD